MRIILDLQACQSGSRFRGIGRYSWSLATQIIKEAKTHNHEVLVLLNANFVTEASDVLLGLDGLIKKENIFFFHVPTPCAAHDPSNEWRHRAAEILREHFLVQLNPDFLQVSTLLADCWADESIASVGEYFQVPTALTHYDLIPLVMQEQYLPLGEFRNNYLRKLESVKRADLLLAISDYTKEEANSLLSPKAGEVINISSSVDEDFGKGDASTDKQLDVMKRYGLRPNFLLYAPGGFDQRKNLNRLIEAFACLPAELRAKHQLVIASKLYDGQLEAWSWKGADAGLATGELVLTDYVADDVLVELYRACHAYVFPSLHEGFGLPVLEAMMCGAAVIASNCTSIPEAVGLQEALFDPTSVEDIARCLNRVLTDPAYLARLHAHGPLQLAKFSWKKTACLALDAMESVHAKAQANLQPKDLNGAVTADDLLNVLNQLEISIQPTVDDLVQFRACFEKNSNAIQK